MHDTNFLRTERRSIKRACPWPLRPRVPLRDAGAACPRRPASASCPAGTGNTVVWTSSLEAWPASGGGLLVGMAIRSLVGDAPFRMAIKTAFLRIDTHGFTTVIVPYVSLESETVRCAAAVVASELGLAPTPDGVAVDQCLVERSGLPARRSPLVDLDPESERGLAILAAAGRMLMIRAAAEAWRIDPARCRAMGGTIFDPTGRRSVAFAQIAQDASLQDLPASVRLCSGAQFPLYREAR
jgi:isoquinoline 1-oxidoreductase beta subunit